MMRTALFATGVLVCCSFSLTADDKENPLSDPEKSIEYQFKLLKDGEVEKLKECFTKRHQAKITKELVTSAQKQTAKLTLDDLVKDVAVKEVDGVKEAKITMKNGRTLTTLILTDGKWLADTIWFK